MIMTYSTTQETDSTGFSREAWIAKLQEGKKSTQQLQSEMLQGVTETVEEIQEKAKEKAEEKAEEEKAAQKGEEAVSVSVSGAEVKVSSDVPETPETSTVEVKA